MHILLTDILSCPRCGPEFGLILLADHIEERRVLSGKLGCANCQNKYRIEDGVADLRQPTLTESTPEQPDMPSATAEYSVSAAAGKDAEAAGTSVANESAERALHWAALMGVAEGPGFLLVVGPAAGLASEIAALVDGIEVIAAALEDAPIRGTDERASNARVSRVVLGDRLPFYSRKVKGVALSGEAAKHLLEEAARVLGPPGRLVLEPAPPDADTRLAQAGMRIVARRADTLVAARA